MNVAPLPFRAALAEYDAQARALLDAWREGDADAVRIIRHNHPRFLDAEITWLPRRMSDAEVRGVTLDLSDARLTVARWYDFGGWPQLAEYVDAKMRAVAEATNTIDTVRLAVLAALNIADEYHLVRKKQDGRTTDYQKRAHQLVHALDEVLQEDRKAG